MEGVWFSNGVRDAINWLFYRVASKGQSRKTLAALANDIPPEPSRSNNPGNGGVLGRPIRLNTLAKGSVTPGMPRSNSYQPR